MPAAALPAPKARLLLSAHHLLIDGDTFPLATLSDAERAALGTVGLPARYKRGDAKDLFISPLYQALSYVNRDYSEGAARPSLLLLADQATPYRVVCEILHTAGEAHFTITLGVASGAAMPVAVDASAPRGSTAASRERVADLSVALVAGGFSVTTPVGNVAPGCQSLGRGLAVSKTDGRYDFKALRSCLEGVQAQQLGNGQAVVSAEPNVPLEAVVATVATLRDGALYPGVSLEVAQ